MSRSPDATPSRDDLPGGLWSPVPEGIWLHPGTLRAVATLAQHAPDIPGDCGAALVVSWLHRLWMWALHQSEDGRTGKLTDAHFAVVAWPESIEERAPKAIGVIVRASLREGGWLVGEGENERLHGFRRIHSTLLKGRERKRESRAKKQASTDESTDRSTDTSEDKSVDTSVLIRPDPDPNPDQTKEEPVPEQGGGAGGWQQAQSVESQGGSSSGGEEIQGPSLSLPRDLGRDGGRPTRAARMISMAQPNTKDPGPDEDGNSRTLYGGAHYLARLRCHDEELADKLRARMGNDPFPGALLYAAAEVAARALEAKLSGRLRLAHEPEPYVRTALARTWTDVLANLADRGLDERAQARRETP